MVYEIPIAVILGQDNKPIRIRKVVINNCDISPWDWADAQRADRLCDKVAVIDCWISSNLSDAVLDSYNWLPIINAHDQIVKDGITLAFFRIEESWCKSERLYAIDARGKIKWYRPEVVLDIARQDTEHRIFCNLDYDNLDNICLTSNKYVLSERSDDYNTNISIASLSGIDTNGICQEEYGLTVLSPKFFRQSDTVLVPEYWTRLFCDVYMISDIGVLGLPKRLDFLELYAFSCSNLKTVIFPDMTASKMPIKYRNTWFLDFSSCDSLEAIDLPPTLNVRLVLDIAGCNALKRITIPKSIRLLSLAVENCNSLNSLILGDEDVISRIENDFKINSCKGGYRLG